MICDNDDHFDFHYHQDHHDHHVQHDHHDYDHSDLVYYCNYDDQCDHH